MALQLELPGLERHGLSDDKLLARIKILCVQAKERCWPGTFLSAEDSSQYWVDSAEVAVRLGFGDRGHWHFSRYLTALASVGMLEMKINSRKRYYRVPELDKNQKINH